jgi:CheY-like chemotaxis protein
MTDVGTETQPGRPLTVVIVEDQEAIAELLSEVLTGAGFAPVRAPSPAHAAACAREAGAAVVLLDVMMPEVSGWTVLDQLRADPATRDTPVVITSAVYGRPGLHPLPPGGPVRFAAKPFDVDELLATVASLLP